MQHSVILSEAKDLNRDYHTAEIPHFVRNDKRFKYCVIYDAVYNRVSVTHLSEILRYGIHGSSGKIFITAHIHHT